MSVYNPHAFGSHYEGHSNATYKIMKREKTSEYSTSFKFLVSLILISLLVSSILLIRINASTTYSDHAIEGETIITVSSGDSLWGIANRHYDNLKDKGFAVHLIKERNQLQSSTISPGQELILPLLN